MRNRFFNLMFVLPVVGLALGCLAGPFFARAHDTVQLAARVWKEQSEGLAEMTLESEAFRDTGRPAEELFAEARQVERRMRLGTALFGAWLGLVAGVRLFMLTGVGRPDTYEIDHAACVACGRCFLSCPRERLRLKKLTPGSPPGVPPTSS